MGIEKPVAIRALIDLRDRSAEAKSDETVNRVYERFMHMMIGYYRSDRAVRQADGAETVFRSLKSSGIKVVLDSGFSRPIIETILDRLGWAGSDLIDATVASDEVSHGRPYPDMIYRAMYLTNTYDVSSVVKVGDTPSDLQEGAAAGCAMIVGVTNGSHTREELAAEPHTHLIDSVADLMAILPVYAMR